MNHLVKLKISLYDTGSIILNPEDSRSCFSIFDKSTFESNSYNDVHHYLFGKSFDHLGSDFNFNVDNNGNDLYYLVKQPILIVDSLSIISMDHTDNDEYQLEENLFIEEIYEDIKDDFESFNDIGVSTTYCVALYEEDWWQSYEGDWDGNVNYLGIISEKFDHKELLRQSSKDNLKKSQKKEEEWMSNI